MKKTALTTIAVALAVTTLMAQVPQSINYQGVARDNTGAILATQGIALQISILSGSPTGTVEYSETHSTTTNQFGLFTLKIGNGTVVSGNFLTIDWGTNTHYVKVEMDETGGANYQLMGTSQLLSVPYALHAENVTNDNVNDADADPANELQAISISNDTIYLSNGGFVTLPVSVAETDPVFSSSAASSITVADTANWNNHTIDTDTQLDSTGVAALGYVAGTHTVNTDTQLDSTDIANLGYVAGTISETDPVFGSSVAGGITGTDTTSWNNKLDTEVDGSVTNELQSLSISNDTIYLSNDGFIKLPADQIDDADADSTNELQTLSLSGDTLFISNGNYIVIAGLGNIPNVSFSCGDNWTDTRDGQTYSTVQIGTQCWMAENLNYGTYVAVTSPQASGTKFCQNLSGANDPTCPMGGLYEWTNLMQGSGSCNGTGAPPNDICVTPVQGLCPTGWHIPSHYELTTLERNAGSNPGAFPYDITTNGFLGTDEGGNMKVTPICGSLPCWNTPNTGATNSTGFTGLPGGLSSSGSSNDAGFYGFWWSSTEFSGTDAWFRFLYYANAEVLRAEVDKLVGFSVRCIQD